MKGYYKVPKKTAETVVNGWLYPGDVIDRKEDVITSGGVNIYPGEIEQVLCSHPTLLDCAVIGVLDDNWGESVKAVVELHPRAVVDAQVLIALCKEKKAPKCVEFLPALRRSSVGKVLKKDLREMYWCDTTRRI